MDIAFCKSKWEMWDAPLDAFLQRVSACGFSATEIYLPSLNEPPEDIAILHREHGLDLVAQVFTEGATPADHVRSLEEQLGVALRCGATFANCHAGRDIFAFEDNLTIFQRLIDLSDETGVPLYVETHRRRPTYSAPETRRYLEALPRLRLTADFSHWMVVHETDLADQEETLHLAVDRSYHIHARIGFEEGPQVPDPRDPRWERHVHTHLTLWQQVVDARWRAGAEVLTITPEFGPPNYMLTHPFTDEPLADVWEINVYMKGLLEQTLETAPPAT